MIVAIRQVVALCVALFAALVGGCGFAIAQTDVEQELLTKAVPAWNDQLMKLRDLDVRYKRWDYSGESTETDAVKSSVSPTFFRLCWKESEGLFLRESGNVDTSDRTRAVVNPEYSFSVKRTQEGPVSELLKCSKRSGHALVSGVHEMGSVEGSRGLVAGTVCIYTVPLPVLLTSKPEFELVKAVRITSSQSPQREVIRVECKYLGPQTQTRRQNGVYWADIDPGRGYVIERAGIRTEGVSDQLIDLTYRQTADFGLLPQMLRTVWTYSNSPNRTVIVCEFDPPTRCDIPSSEFHLSGYGLPETILDVPKRSIWFRILAVAVSVVTLVAGFWFFYWKDRQHNLNKS
jgi:hypothetical protein